MKVEFDETKRPLVVCDIDHTFIKCEFDFNHIMNFLNTSKRFKLNFNLLYQETVHWMEFYYNTGYICQTDPVGFEWMREKVRALGGKLIFLTARSHVFHGKTLEDLEKVGLTNPEEYEIHYTNNNSISKGAYLKSVGIVDDYDHVTFIDDNQEYLDSVRIHFPKIQCYKFNYNS